MAAARTPVERQKTANAHRGFTLDGDLISIEAHVAGDGSLWIKQGRDHVMIPKHAIIAFKNAVADLKDIL